MPAVPDPPSDMFEPEDWRDCAWECMRWVFDDDVSCAVVVVST